MSETVEGKRDSVGTFKSGMMMAYFIKHAWLHGTDEDKRLSHFLLTNMAKGVLITNTILCAVYLSRFRTYRNSSLAFMHIPATLFGIHNATIGTKNVFMAYMFDSCELR